MHNTPPPPRNPHEAAARRARYATPARATAAPALAPATAPAWAPATAHYLRELHREHARTLWSTAPHMAHAAAAAVTPPPAPGHLRTA